MVTRISREEAIRILSSPRSFIIADCTKCGHEMDVKVNFVKYINVEKQIADTACENCQEKTLVLGSTI